MTTFDQELTAQLADIKSAAHQRQAVEAQAAVMDLHPLPHKATEEEKATYDDKAKAVLDLFDMQERAMFTFMMLGDLAKTIHEKQDKYEGKKIEFGFPQRYLTPEIKSLFKTWKFEETKYGYHYFYTPPIRWNVRIPVEIRVWHRHYEFFDNPDFGFFGTEMLHIPNPFDKYWKARNFIQ